jgi:hypothetical protein
VKLAAFLRQRGEREDAVLDERGALERLAARQFVIDRKGKRP